MYDKCFLCKTAKVYNINSHLTPAGITENTYGERNKEVIYTIDAQERVIDKYFGREYPQNEITSVKKAPNARKGIFCEKCETDLGVYESAVQSKLKTLINGIGIGVKLHRTKLDAKFVNIDIHPNILIAFFLSVVWRQCLEQTLDNKDNPLNEKQFEELRIILIRDLSKPTNAIINDGLITNPRLSIFTTYNTKTLVSFVNPSPVDTNPQLFFIGPVVLLYWLNMDVCKDFEKITSLNSNLLDNELLIEKGRIAVINETSWKKLHRQTANVIAGQYSGKSNINMNILKFR